MAPADDLPSIDAFVTTDPPHDARSAQEEWNGVPAGPAEPVTDGHAWRAAETSGSDLAARADAYLGDPAVPSSAFAGAADPGRSDPVDSHSQDLPFLEGTADYAGDMPLQSWAEEPSPVADEQGAAWAGGAAASTARDETEKLNETLGARFDLASGWTSAPDATHEVPDPRSPSPSAASWPDDVWDDAADDVSASRGHGPQIPRGADAGPADDGEERGGSEGGRAGAAGAGAAARTNADGPGAHPLADALDAIARKIRAGELPGAGYEEGMGDAAALAAALASVLGVRKS